MRYSVRNIS